MIKTCSPIAAAPLKLWFQIIGGGALVASFGLILTSPTQQMRHVNMNCQDRQLPATRINSSEGQVSSECLVVQSVTRESSLWVY